MLKSGPVWAVGAMSGTSLDGVDAALVLTDGTRILDFGRTDYRPYTEAERATLHAALGHWPDEAGVEEAAEVVETAHAELLSGLGEAQLVGFHGQTLAHDPDGRHGPRRTHQAGDGSVLAEVLGKPVVWDFRSTDVEMGGQGAPLAPFFHFACAKYAGLEAPAVFLNLGGVGNVTWIDPRQPSAEVPGAVLAFDTGPANAPINDLMRLRRKAEFDAGGELALAGTVDEAALEAFLAHPFFLRMPPKSLDRDEFQGALAQVSGLDDAGAAATLTACAAASVARAGEHYPAPPSAIYVTGGGRLNTAMMVALQSRMNVPVLPVEDIGLDGDMLEAQAFAYLAVRVARGMATSGPSTTGVAALIGGGIVSRPG